MPLYNVVVRLQSEELWRVEADSPEEAMRKVRNLEDPIRSECLQWYDAIPDRVTEFNPPG